MNKDKVINDLLSRIAQLEYEVERLNNIIEEAIEYIVHPTFTGKHSTNEEVLVDILRILKGSDKE